MIANNEVTISYIRSKLILINGENEVGKISLRIDKAIIELSCKIVDSIFELPVQQAMNYCDRITPSRVVDFRYYLLDSGFAHAMTTDFSEISWDSVYAISENVESRISSMKRNLSMELQRHRISNLMQLASEVCPESAEVSFFIKLLEDAGITPKNKDAARSEDSMLWYGHWADGNKFDLLGKGG